MPQSMDQLESLVVGGLYVVGSWLLVRAMRISNNGVIKRSDEAKPLYKYFDHTILKADTTVQALNGVIEEAKLFRFQSICVNSCHAKYVKEKLLGYDDIRICCVVGFPLGAMETSCKVNEAIRCIKDGATEIDMVMNIGYYKSGNNYRKLFINDLKAVIDACHQHNVICKVILETCLLSLDEVRDASILALETGAGTNNSLPLMCYTLSLIHIRFYQDKHWLLNERRHC